MSTSLQSLPGELLSTIVDQLVGEGEENIGNFRLTCREIHEKTMFDFGFYHFRCLFVDVDIGGLSRLLEVSRHHHFSPLVREIYMSSDILKVSNAFNGSVLDFVRSGSFACELGLGIGRFENLEYIELEQAEINQDLEGSAPFTFREVWTEIIQATLSAIVTHQVHLKGFVTQHPIGACCPPDISILRPVSKATKLFDLMTKLRLNLFVCEDMGMANQSDKCKQVLTSLDPGKFVPVLIKILKQTKMLEMLDLSFDRTDRSNKILSEILEQVSTLTKLRRLALQDTILSDVLLFSLLRKHKTTVRNVSLGNLFLTSGKWSHFFQFVLTELSLESLNMMHLQEGDIYSDCAVSFSVIHEMRPVIDHCWWHKLKPRPDEEELEFLKTFSYVKVEKLPAALYLTDGEGENLRDWLVILAQGYELVEDYAFDLVGV